MNSQWLRMMTLPYARMELPGWGKLLRLAGIFEDPKWKSAGRKIVAGKWHGYVMDLDLANWSERQTFFLGRFSDLSTQLLLHTMVRDGDCFVDIGANIGMITLVAASCVGDTGQVISVEPNPLAFNRLRSCVAQNGLTGRVHLLNVGLADSPGELELSVVTEHTGMGTFSHIPTEEHGNITQRHRCAVETGDGLLENMVRNPLVIKIDVEGYEYRVIRGLARILATHRPAVIMEVVPDYLARAGDSTEQLFDLMQGAGYRGYGLTSRRHLLRHCLKLNPVSKPSMLRQNNVVWLHPGGCFEARLHDYLCTASD